MTISTIIKNELEGYKRQPVEIVDGYFYNQYDTINRIYLYMNDSFAGPVPEGSVFWNFRNR